MADLTPTPDLAADAAADACAAEVEQCTASGSAQGLRIAAVFIILGASALGVLLPALSHHVKALRKDSGAFLVVKAFAAGVILATGFIHMFPEAHENLANECLGWPDYPYAGMIATAAVIGVQLIEFLTTQYYERAAKRQGPVAPKLLALVPHGGHGHDPHGDHTTCGLTTTRHACGSVEDGLGSPDKHQDGAVPADGSLSVAELHGHTHPQHRGEADRAAEGLRHVAIAQVLELGIAFHSVLIGIAVGVSRTVCSIRPLLIALTFHQFFEGIALGGCLVQAEFKAMTYLVMAAIFALTTPLGVVIGIGVRSTYNEKSPTALATSGVFDSVSAGILIYMALVDLLAVDFSSKKLRSSWRLQVAAYTALLAGAGFMALLAKWA